MQAFATRKSETIKISSTSLRLASILSHRKRPSVHLNTHHRRRPFLRIDFCCSVVSVFWFQDRICKIDLNSHLAFPALPTSSFELILRVFWFLEIKRFLSEVTHLVQ